MYGFAREVSIEEKGDKERGNEFQCGLKMIKQAQFVFAGRFDGYE